MQQKRFEFQAKQSYKANLQELEERRNKALMD